MANYITWQTIATRAAALGLEISGLPASVPDCKGALVRLEGRSCLMARPTHLAVAAALLDCYEANPAACTGVLVEVQGRLCLMARPPSLLD